VAATSEVPEAPATSEVPEAPGPRRRRWVLDPPPHVLPTEAGDYVLLTKARPAAPGSPQLAMVPPLAPSAADPLFPVPMLPRTDKRLQPLQPELRVQPQKAVVQLKARRAAATIEPRHKPPVSQSVVRLRRARGREEEQIAAAVLASKRLAAQQTAPQTAAEEEAALEAAVRASLELSAEHAAMGSSMVRARTLPNDDADEYSQLAAAIEASQQHCVASPAPALRNLSTALPGNSGVADEEERQLAAAIEASLQEQAEMDAAAKADERYHQEATRLACLDSLRAACDERSRPQSRHNAITTRGISTPGAPDARGSAAAIGRGLARAVLEAS